MSLIATAPIDPMHLPWWALLLIGASFTTAGAGLHQLENRLSRGNPSIARLLNVAAIVIGFGGIGLLGEAVQMLS